MAKLRLLLDENIGILVAQRLRKEGYDIISILEDMPGVQDTKVLAKAIREQRILVTLDRDFGLLVFHKSKRHVGVLFLRLRKESTETITRVLLGILSQYGNELSKRFVVGSESRVRIRES